MKDSFQLCKLQQNAFRCVAHDKTFVLMSTIPVNLLIKTNIVKNAPSVAAKAC